MSRQARVSEHGAAVFLTADDLLQAGVDPETTDAISFTVDQGRISLNSASDD